LAIVRNIKFKKVNFVEINNLIVQKFGSDALIETHQENGLMPFSVIKSELLVDICSFLYTNPQLYFDFLACITAIDNGPQTNTLEVVYNLTSIPFSHTFCLKVILQRESEGENLPQIETVSHLWRTAIWHEREAFDLVGIHFNNHPDLRRILLTADWVGHPLRKDYKTQETYHEIKIDY
jgi:NADH-quinone oxidoreductase subunit C